MKEKIWLVTGASGHLGNTVVRQLLARGEKVRALVIEEERPKALEGLKIEVFSGDVTQPESLDPFFTGLEGKDLMVLHLASMITIYTKASPRVYQVNVQGTKNMLAKAKEYQASRFLYCGTVHTLPLPSSFDDEIKEINFYDPDLVHGDYAKSKAMASQLVLDAAKEGLDTVIVQPSGILGPNDYLDGNFTRLFEKLVDGKIPAMIQGSYNFVDVKDVARGLIEAAEKGKTGESYNLTGHDVSILDIMNMTAEMAGRKPYKKTVPFFLAQVFAPITEFLSKKTGKVPVLTSYSLFTMKSPHRFSHEKAAKELGYTIRPLEETIYETLQFMVREKRFKKKVSLRRVLSRA